jgi:hypothetical protein
VTGYLGRVISHFHNHEMAPYIIQAITLLIAPALLAASIYMVLGRLMRFVNGEHYSIIRINWVTKLFVCGDILSFTLQAGGNFALIGTLTECAGAGIMSGQSSSSAKLGKNIIVVGLIVQLLFFGFFVMVAAAFHRRIIRKPTSQSERHGGKFLDDWKTILYALYVASVLILIRSVFRIIEYLNGKDGYIQSHEAFLYIFDGVLMLGVIIIFNVVHPGKVMSVGRRGVEMNSWNRDESSISEAELASKTFAVPSSHG